MASDAATRLTGMRMRSAFGLPTRLQRDQRGLTLLECSLALVIVGLTVLSVLEANFRTVSAARRARNNLQAALLANEIMSLECMGDFPQSPEDGLMLKSMQEVLPDDRWVDEETGYFPYRGYFYEVEKEIEEISADTDLSMTAEEREEQELQGAATPEEEPKTLEIVRVTVTIRYPLVADPDKRGSNSESGGDYATLVLETYVIDSVRQQALADQAGAGAADAGDGGAGR